MKKLWLPAFAAFSLLHMAGVVTGTDLLCTISKPLLMPLLALWLAAETTGTSSSLRTGWLLGLAFSTLGDILLMFSGGMFFLLGLSAFLLAHLAYIWAINTGLRNQRGFVQQRLIWVLPFVLYLGVFLYWLWDGIPGGMRVPVAVYALVISTMALSVFNLKGYIPAQIFQTMMGGALLFVLSDSLIAVNKFGHAFEGGHLAVIATYIAGQWLLAKGVGKLLTT